jgi:hypothetical protein
LKIFIPVLSVFIIGCNPQPTNKSGNRKADCPPGEDTINLKMTFTKIASNSPTERFYSIVDLIMERKFFKPKLDKVDKLFITHKDSLSFPMIYDTCNMQRLKRKFIILKNIQVSELDFKGLRPEKISKFTPSLHFEEWQFSNNAERDSAFIIVKSIYNFPKTMLLYEKRYSQFIIDDKRIYLLESRAKFAEQYAIGYKKLIEQYITQNK